MKWQLVKTENHAKAIMSMSLYGTNFHIEASNQEESTINDMGIPGVNVSVWSISPTISRYICAYRRRMVVARGSMRKMNGYCDMVPEVWQRALYRTPIMCWRGVCASCGKYQPMTYGLVSREARAARYAICEA